MVLPLSPRSKNRHRQTFKKTQTFRMRVAIFLVASFYRKRDKLRLDGWLSSTAGFSFAYNITQTIQKALTSETKGNTCVPSSHLSAIQKILTHDRVTIVAAKFVQWSLYETCSIYFAIFYFRWQPRTICVKISKNVSDKFFMSQFENCIGYLPDSNKNLIDSRVFTLWKIRVMVISKPQYSFYQNSCSAREILRYFIGKH